MNGTGIVDVNVRFLLKTVPALYPRVLQKKQKVNVFLFIKIVTPIHFQIIKDAVDNGGNKVQVE